ncbi:PREDICTED: protein phosphatase 1 regulatory subunit 3A [Gavialis gangeticus]|uniref:protein phosphatase 1 regulatory subunit 3A n=1 Tax=Gavialis gangeticus TaxID=94835 RepID=UPI00092FBDFF|nr:PREDICTED: protein phosphatase 1 regulatory subunit 3A [Gavialis gangeticus]
MESFEEPSQVSRDNLLEVPTLSDPPSEDEDVKTTLKPRFSPLPRRRNSASSEDTEPEIPSTITRKVSFADAFGFDLVSVKEFDTWEVPTTSQNDVFEDEVEPVEEYFLSPLFTLPASQEDLLQKVHEEKVLLESVFFLPGVTCMNGIIRVLNISFEKLIYVRMTLDDWQSHYDILADYVPNSYDGETDQFFFKISLVPPYQRDEAKVEFCIRYETSVGTFWANNDDKNYILVCHKKVTKQEVDNKTQEDFTDKYLKGCLKTTLNSKEEILATSDDDIWNNSRTSGANIPEIIYSQEEDKDMEPINKNVKDTSVKYNEGDNEDNEKELELLLNQHFTGTRSTSSRDERNLYTTEPVNFPNEAQGLENKLTLTETSTDLLRQPVPITSSSENILQELEELHDNDNKKYSIGYNYSQPSAQELTAGSVNISEQPLECTDTATLLSQEYLPGTKQNETIGTPDIVSSRQEMSYVDVSKGETDSASGSKMMERLFISEDDAYIYKETYEMRLEAICAEHDKPTQLSACATETLDDNANPAVEQHMVQMSSQTLDSLLADTDKSEGEVNMTESKDQVHVRTDLYAGIFAHSETQATELLSTVDNKHEDNPSQADDQICSHIADKRKAAGSCEVTEFTWARDRGHSGNKSKEISSYVEENQREEGYSELSDDFRRIDSEYPDATQCRVTIFPTSASNAMSLNPDDVSSTGENGHKVVDERLYSQCYFSTNSNVLHTDPCQPKSASILSEDKNRVIPENQSWGVSERQLVERECEANRSEHIKEQTGGQVTWGMQDNSGCANVTPREELFTCHEAVGFEKSSVSEHDITQEAEASTAYIIKTTSESAPEKMSASEKAVIAKLPQETALSDRPTEEKETAFDTHEGRNDGSHYTLCQRNTVGVLYDTEFEKKSVLDIYNAHEHETLQGEAMSVCNIRERLAKAEHDIRNIPPAEKTLWASATEEQSLEQDLRSEESSKSPTNPQLSLYSKEIEELQKEESIFGTHSHLGAKNETKMPPSDTNIISSYHYKNSSVTSSEESIKIIAAEAENTGHPNTDSAFKPLPNVSAESGYDFNPTSEMTHINKTLSPEVEHKEALQSSDLLTSSNGREKNIGQCFHQTEFRKDKSLGPMILISEPIEEVEETASQSEGLITEGKILNWHDGSQHGRQHVSDSADICDQKNEAHSLPSESLVLKRISHRIFFFLFFVVFVVTLCHYDLTVCFALYLFSLYWLYWAGGRCKESVKKE